ncbi:37S ribosomal protein S9, mitochondrial [Sorochytrium milnesiophthora]
MLRQLFAQSRRWTSSAAAGALARPASPAYFTGNADLHDLRYRIRTLAAAKSSEPLAISSELTRLFKSREILQHEHGLRLSPEDYERLTADLAALYPLRQDPEVADLLADFVNKHFEDKSFGSLSNLKLDAYGRSHATSGRKTSRAHVYVLRGDGDVMVNGVPVGEYFLRREAENVLYPLQVTQSLGQFSVWGVAKGGGPTGQSESLASAIARALLPHNPEWHEALSAVGLLERDPRMVERKKTGQKKARKKFTWVKR